MDFTTQRKKEAEHFSLFCLCFTDIVPNNELLLYRISVSLFLIITVKDHSFAVLNFLLFFFDIQ